VFGRSKVQATLSSSVSARPGSHVVCPHLWHHDIATLSERGWGGHLRIPFIEFTLHRHDHRDYAGGYPSGTRPLGDNLLCAAATVLWRGDHTMRMSVWKRSPVGVPLRLRCPQGSGTTRTDGVELDLPPARHTLLLSSRARSRLIGGGVSCSRKTGAQICRASCGERGWDGSCALPAALFLRLGLHRMVPSVSPRIPISTAARARLVPPTARAYGSRASPASPGVDENASASTDRGPIRSTLTHRNGR